MWNADSWFYYDLDVKERQTELQHIGAYWTLLAEIPNEERADGFIAHLSDPEVFGTENPFPVIPANHPDFSESGNGYNGGVVPFFTYMVVKGLERYGQFEFARECSIRHLYFILDTLHPNGEDVGDVWEAYLPAKEGPSQCPDIPDFPKQRFIPMVGMITITLMIEDIIGLVISLPRKTVDWTMTTLEAMGIEGLSLKRNMITILSNKQARGWEIRLESEKLYYFTIEILDEKKKKTLPIPSGKCSMLIDKL
jgi:neutral trehalase